VINEGDVITIGGQRVRVTSAGLPRYERADMTRKDREREDARVRERARALAAAYHAERTARLWAHCRTMTDRRLESLRNVPAWVMGVGR
jgi:hypothetical protein